jgi:uncharacterized membrane protein SpoIIM required for sporulation
MIPEWMIKPEAKQYFIKFLLFFVIVAFAGGIIGNSFPESNTITTVQNSYGMPYGSVENVTGVKIPEYEPNQVNSIVVLFINDMIIASIALIASIYTNNLLPYAITAVNGFSLGAVAGKYITTYNSLFVLSNIIPHSLIEVPIMCLACAGGLYYYYHETDVTATIILKSLAIIAVFLLLSGIIETFITPGIATFVGIRYGVM